MQSLSRSRDENLRGRYRVGPAAGPAAGPADRQRRAIAGRAAQRRPAPGARRPAAAARVRAAIARDIDRIRAASVTDVPGLLVKLDELARRWTNCRWPTRLPLRVPRRRRASRTRRRALQWWEACLARHPRGGAQPGARQPDRPARGRAAGARAGLLPARKPQVQAAQCAARHCWRGRPIRRAPTSPRRRRRCASTSIRLRAGPRPPPRCCSRCRRQLRTVELPRIDETLAVLATALRPEERPTLARSLPPTLSALRAAGRH